MERRRLLLHAATMALVGRVSPTPAAAASLVGGSVAVEAVPGFRLRLARVVCQPGWVGGFDGAFVACVVAGELSVGLEDGYAAIWHAGTAADGRDAEPLLPGKVARLGNGDCIASDSEGTTTAGSLRNRGPASAEVWEAGLSPMPLMRTQPCERRTQPTTPPSS